MVGAIEGQGSRGLNPTNFNKVPTPTHYQLYQLKTTIYFKMHINLKPKNTFFSQYFKTKTYISLYTTYSVVIIYTSPWLAHSPYFNSILIHIPVYVQ